MSVASPDDVELGVVIIDVGADFFRRVRITGGTTQSTCGGVAELSSDIVAEIRPDAFHFTEASFSGSE